VTISHNDRVICTRKQAKMIVDKNYKNNNDEEHGKSVFSWAQEV